MSARTSATKIRGAAIPIGLLLQYKMLVLPSVIGKLTLTRRKYPNVCGCTCVSVWNILPEQNRMCL